MQLCAIDIFLKKIFSGEYKYWDEIDDSLEHKEIVVVIRDLGGGAHIKFKYCVNCRKVS